MGNYLSVHMVYSMSVVITIPKRLVEEARKKGIDVEDVIIRALAQVSGLDPQIVAWSRLDIAEKMLEEAREYIAKNNVIQASEKLYKAVEECIKALAEVLRVQVLEEAERRGKWETWLLGKASRQLAEKLGEDRIRLAWKDAYDIHVWGFHEHKYDIDDVRAALPLAKWLLNYAKEVLKTLEKNDSKNT